MNTNSEKTEKSSNLNYEQILDYLESLGRIGIKLGLTNITALLQRLGDPFFSFKTIHIGGTNGKGSVTAMCTSILSKAGYKVGRYTSPHLTHFTERIQINGKEISEEEVIKYFPVINKEVEELRKENVYITYFEFVTALAFFYFKEQKVDLAVVEVGLGGRLDATNVIHPEVAVITNIGLDHQEFLGKDLLSIAKEKAGIIKENSVLVTTTTQKRVLNLFVEVCQEKKALFIPAFQQGTVKVKETNLDGQTLKVNTPQDEYIIHLKLIGAYQKANTLAAIRAMECCQQKGIRVSKSDILEGLQETKWPGRLEVMQRNPLVVLDCAHNPHGMRELIKSIKNFPYQKLLLVLGIASGKDYSTMAHLITPLAGSVIVTRAQYRGLEVEILRKEVKCAQVEVVPDVVTAAKRAMEKATEKDLVLIAGSIFMVGEARTIWYPQKLRFFT